MSLRCPPTDGGVCRQYSSTRRFDTGNTRFNIVKTPTDRWCHVNGKNTAVAKRTARRLGGAYAPKGRRIISQLSEEPFAGSYGRSERPSSEGVLYFIVHVKSDSKKNVRGETDPRESSDTVKPPSNGTARPSLTVPGAVGYAVESRHYRKPDGRLGLDCFFHSNRRNTQDTPNENGIARPKNNSKIIIIRN